MRTLKHIVITVLLALCAIVSRAQGKDFRLNSGVQLSTYRRTAIDVRPAYFKDFTWGRLAAEFEWQIIAAS